MKAIYHAYITSKFRNLIDGFMIAILAQPFFIWGISIMLSENPAYSHILYPFIGILICLLFGLRTLFRESKTDMISI